MAFCLLAVLIGAVLASALPIIQVAFGLVALALIGFGAAVLAGLPVGSALGGSALLFVCAQVGYVAGLAAMAVVASRRRRTQRAAQPGPLGRWHSPLPK